MFGIVLEVPEAEGEVEASGNRSRVNQSGRESLIDEDDAGETMEYLYRKKRLRRSSVWRPGVKCWQRRACGSTVVECRLRINGGVGQREAAKKGESALWVGGGMNEGEERTTTRNR